LKLDILNPAKKLKASYQRLHIDRAKIELFKENIKRAFQDIATADKKRNPKNIIKPSLEIFCLIHITKEIIVSIHKAEMTWSYIMAPMPKVLWVL
jgi:hypothetical protein